MPNTKPKKRRPTQIIGGADETLPVELELAAGKFQRQQERIVKAEGASASASNVAITGRWLPELAEGIQQALADTRGTRAVYAEFLAVIRGLEPEVLALCILQGTLHSIGRQKNYRDTALRIARAIQGECWAKSLIERDPKFAKRTEERVRKRYSSSKRRSDAARAIAARRGYKTTDWSDELCLQAGTWALDLLLKTLPDVFTDEDREKNEEKFLTISNGAQAYADMIVAAIIRRSTVWLPLARPSRPWTGYNEGGTDDKRLALSLSLVRSWHEETRKAVNKAIRDGSMRPAINALNALQAVPWMINQRILDVLKACWENGIAVPGLPRKEPLRVPEYGNWEQFTDGERAFLRRRTDEIRLANFAMKGGHVGMKEDVETAECMAQYERFFTPMNFDFRGRVYALPHFNFQRDDRVRALFLFADGEPLGEDGLYWLKVHTANRGDFDKVSKRPFAERVKWVDDNLSSIHAVAEAPLKELWWTEADKPFQFLAACMELRSALREGPAYVSTIPVSFDGSCSGLQHLCAMTRAPEGALVNLAPHEIPQDIYQQVAERVKALIENDDNIFDYPCRRQWLKRTIDRKTVKSDVMTYFYSITAHGMNEDRREEVGLELSKYFTKHVRAAIEEVVDLPAKAMTFLRGLARAVAANNGPLEWSSPAGFPWSNHYPKKRIKQVRLWLQDRTHTVKLATDLSEIDGAAAARGASPNFVHACDAAHLLRTVNAAVAEGITSIATVHDSFGCLPSRATSFRRLIRREFVRMYQEHDVLQEVFDRAANDLGGSRKLPSGPPPKGNLDIEQATDAEYAFA
jgi:DNA-directed RNA polymerase